LAAAAPFWTCESNLSAPLMWLLLLTIEMVVAQGPLPPCLGKIVLWAHRSLTISADRCRPSLPSTNIRLMTASSNRRSPRPW
jgi:hypothetical protein